MKVFIKSLSLTISLIFIAFSLQKCNSNQERVEIDPAFGAYVSAYSSGVLSKHDAIRIRLVNTPNLQVDYGEAIKEDLFDFKPGIEGTAYLIDQNTIEFKPAEPMDENTMYTAAFDLSKVTDVKEEFETFTFQFQTIKQDFNLYTDGLSPKSEDDLKVQQLKGRIVTADQADSNAVFSMLRAEQNSSELKVKWEQLSKTEFQFTIVEIQRSKDEGMVSITVDGDPLDIDREEIVEFEIPALGDFKVVSVKVVQSPKQYVEIRFSDPLKKQNLNGLISIEEGGNLQFIHQSNVVKVYPSNRLTGNKTIMVAEGIRNILDYKTTKLYTTSIQFEQTKPKVRMVGDGVILPNSNGLIVPFEAVSLEHVDVIVKRIFENNVLQFLQNNDLEGDYRLKRVARIVKHQRINLGDFGKTDLHTWNRFHLDLSEILQTEPGAIYRIELRFKKAYSLYQCEGADSDEETLSQIQSAADNDWDGEPDLEGYDDYYYNWRERDDPCSRAYYAKNYRNSIAARNIIATDLGIIAKLGGDRTMHVTVNDLVTTSPISGATVEFYDYQQQLISTTSTNNDGMATAELSREPFVVVAKYQEQSAYLKVKDGNALSMSKFDISGNRVEGGVKGFLYGERGVWRPGDSLYLTFMLEDKQRVLPPNHPVHFELYNPKNKLVQRKVAIENTDGFYDFRTATHPDDPTGYYRAVVKVGNRKFRKSLRIETVKPNRLKIYLDFGGETIYSEKDEINGELKVNWLHGAKAGDLKAKVDMTLSSSNTKFKGFSQYNFDDPARDFEAQSKTILDGRLSQEGIAQLPLQFSTMNAPGMLRASFNTKVFEPGGNFSVDRYSIDYSPYSNYVGINVPQGTLYGNTLVTDNQHVIDIQSLTEKGKIAPNRKVEIEVFKIQWRWWWESRNSNIGNYISQRSVVPIQEQTLTTNNKGKANYNFQIDRPEWGRYLIRVKDKESGHIAGKVVYVDWPYWARSNRKVSENANMLGFSIHKDNYKVGENVEVTFPSSLGGRALVSIENGTKVLEKFWVPTEDGETKFEFTAHENMAPNAYIHISLLQPHETTLNDHPIRMYGVIPLMVENENTHLNPVIETVEVFRPESTTSVKVTERDGKDMTYTLAIVDDGLLDLTRFKTPDPWNHFYAREALGVKTWDLYDYVIGAYGGELDRLMAIGGDGAAGKKNDRKANRFKPMVRFIGPFQYSGGTNKHNIEIPNYVGSVRVMVVAGKDFAYGNTEKTVPVRNPLMVLATLPRVLSPGETVEVPVNVFAMEEKVKNVSVNIEVNEAFELVGSNKQTIKFSEVGDKVINFKLKVKEKTGFGKVKVTAAGNGEKARDEIELNVRAPNPYITNIKDTVIEGGKSIEIPVNWVGLEGTNSSAVEFNNFPPLGLENRLNYLIRYPYGCIEQTVSSVFPQLYLGNLIALNSDKKQEINTNIQKGLQRLVNFQTNDGGFAYWPGNTYSNAWGSNYAGHFMLEAEEKGFSIPLGLKNNWLNHQKEKARYWGNGDNLGARHNQLIQAYRLYTLALAGEPELGAMNRMKEMSGLYPQSIWRLAAAYHLAGQKDAAFNLVASLPQRVESYRELGHSYGSGTRDEAMILETLVLMNQQSDALALMKNIAAVMRSDQWMSTQTTAYSLMAVSKYLGGSTPEEKMNFTYNWPLGNETVNANYPIHKISGDDSKLPKSGTLKVQNTGQNRLYVRVTSSGIPLTDDRVAQEENINFEVNYETMNGTPLDPTRLPQGTDFIAEVKVENPGKRGNYNEMVINQLFPSGWEIINSRMEAGPNTVATDVAEYQDIRDDRVYTYFDLNTYKSKTFRIQLNATYLGRFYLPVVSAGAMYDNAINARTNGKWIEVVPQD